ncbi:hypothetical protein BC830DRAFT_1083328 [Chytriomyces sp. MP71]|nr:hypothetical protein BC830DRAFT_1083328 [Chytriomyces sp. MP71]
MFQRPCWSVDQLPDLSGRVALVSGGSNGLGLHTAIQLRAKGAQVIVISRTWTTSASEAEASPPDEDTAMDRKQGPKIEHIWADFSDLDSVKAAADKFKQRNLPLHILVNNVGCIADFSLAKHGIETQFTVNHFGPVVLTNELLPVIEASQPSRIVNITSMAHMFVFPKIFYENVNNQKVFDPEVRYNETKLANIHFTRELQRRLDAKYANLSRECAIYVNCVHPGAVDTNGPRENPKGHDVKNKLINSIRISVEKGALTQIYVAGARDVEEKGWKGKYFVPYCELADPSAIATNQDQAERTWDWTAYMLREHFDPDFDYCV